MLYGASHTRKSSNHGECHHRWSVRWVTGGGNKRYQAAEDPVRSCRIVECLLHHETVGLIAAIEGVAF